MPNNSQYGSQAYGSFIYSGTPGQYLSTDTLLVLPTILGSYVETDTSLGINKSSYVETGVFPLRITRGSYLDTTSALFWLRDKNVNLDAFLKAVKNIYLTTNTTFEVFHKGSYLETRTLLYINLSPYEVDEFQVIVDRQFVTFYWKDSSPGTGKTYTIYDSVDSGVTWNFIGNTAGLTFQLNRIPYDIPTRIYKIVITSGSSTSFGVTSYPAFSFRRILNELDNGYWDVDPTSNVYLLTQGIAKEAHSRAELEIAYTQQDESILNIRKSRISDVYGIPFSQTTVSADEEYRRKIWNLFLGFRNAMTYKGLYYVVKAFTDIPPRITSLTAAYGWYLGIRWLGIDTIPLATGASDFGVRFEITVPQTNSGTVVSTDSTSVFTAVSSTIDGFVPVDNFYNGQFLVFDTGNNRGLSEQILASHTVDSTSTRFTTNPFTFDSSNSDTFFITKVSTDTLKQYIREVIPLHSQSLFLFFTQYITENQNTKFSGTFKNIEIIPSDRLRVHDVNVTVDDEGRQVQAVYESGNTLSAAYPLFAFGSLGIVVWDDIEWGNSGIDFRMYVSFASSLISPNWKYQSGATNFIQFTGATEVGLTEYIKAGSEVVSDTTGHIYINTVDYIMDYRSGTIRRTLTGALMDNTLISVKYDVEWGQVVQNQSLSFIAGQNYFKYKFVVNGLVDRSAFEFSGFYLKKLS